METITLQQLHDGEFYPCDQVNDRVFREIVAGIVMAGDKPGGAIVAVGEELKIWGQPGRNFYLVAEGYESENFKLIEKAIEMVADCKIKKFYGRLNDTFMQILTAWNRNHRGYGSRDFLVSPAPFAKDNGLIEYHINILQSKLTPNNKTLFLGEGSAVKKDFLTLERSDLTRAKDIEFPSIAALGYAVTALDTHRYDASTEYLRARDKERNSNYEPLGRR